MRPYDNVAIVVEAGHRVDCEAGDVELAVYRDEVPDLVGITNFEWG
jgi:hypothetical protein